MCSVDKLRPYLLLKWLSLLLCQLLMFSSSVSLQFQVLHIGAMYCRYSVLLQPGWVMKPCAWWQLHHTPQLGFTWGNRCISYLSAFAARGFMLLCQYTCLASEQNTRYHWVGSGDCTMQKVSCIMQAPRPGRCCLFSSAEDWNTWVWSFQVMLTSVEIH